MVILNKKSEKTHFSFDSLKIKIGQVLEKKNSLSSTLI